MSELARELPIESTDGRLAAALDVDVQGVCYDSRRVVPGDLFVAWRGEAHDGSLYASEAVRRGAVAVLTPGPTATGPAVSTGPVSSGPVSSGPTAVGAPGGDAVEISVPHLVAADPRRLLGPLASRLYGHPDRELLHIGITGTNGKSTVMALLVAILEAAGRPAGHLGTLGYGFRELDLGRGRTTPEGSDYFRLLRELREAGAEAVVAEVSSHALAQGRVAGCRYDLALFTNLTQDHLDYHADLEAYFDAKRTLFHLLDSDGRAAIGVDDIFGRRLLAEFPAAVSFGLEPDAAVGPVEIEQGVQGRGVGGSGGGLEGSLRTPRGELRFVSRLVGDYNLRNILAAVAAAEALDLEPRAIAAGLAACQPLTGRMELVSRRGEISAFVDFAHTEAALRAALGSARRLGDGRLIVVFGCGGDRDRGKRAPMGRVAGELADIAIVTSDNPRSEPPEAIVAEVEAGIEASGGEYQTRVDRREAIRLAVALAAAGDVVLVAGKGHERTQTLGDREIPFSDQDELLAALEDRLGPSKVG